MDAPMRMQPSALSLSLVARSASPPLVTVTFACLSTRQSLPLTPWFAAVTFTAVPSIFSVSLPVMPLLALPVTVSVPPPAMMRPLLAYRQAFGSSSVVEEKLSLSS